LPAALLCLPLQDRHLPLGTSLPPRNMAVGRD
jgi:hypothetical protein